MNTVITYSRYGGPEVLSVSQADIPRPGPGQVRVRVRAVAVNPIDAKVRSGRLDGVFPAHGVRFTGQDPADRAPEALPELAARLADGALTVPVWRGYPLAEAARAHADLEAGRNHGKIILLP